MELEARARRCCRARNHRRAERPRKSQVATQLSASIREPWRADDSMVFGAFPGHKDLLSQPAATLFEPARLRRLPHVRMLRSSSRAWCLQIMPSGRQRRGWVAIVRWLYAQQQRHGGRTILTAQLLLKRSKSVRILSLGPNVCFSALKSFADCTIRRNPRTSRAFYPDHDMSGCST